MNYHELIDEYISTLREMLQWEIPSDLKRKLQDKTSDLWAHRLNTLSDGTPDQKPRYLSCVALYECQQCHVRKPLDDGYRWQGIKDGGIGGLQYFAVYRCKECSSKRLSQLQS